MMGLDYLLLTGDHPIPGQGGYFGDLAPIHGPIVVGEDAFIGARAIILPGEQIGRGATGEAGALLDKDVPAGAPAVGHPARVVRTRVPVVPHVNMPAKVVRCLI